MLARSAASSRIQADAARLPLAGGGAAAVIIGDGPLFAAEAARIMAAEAVLVWSNALGDGAPWAACPRSARPVVVTRRIRQVHPNRAVFRSSGAGPGVSAAARPAEARAAHAGPRQQRLQHVSGGAIRCGGRQLR